MQHSSLLEIWKSVRTDGSQEVLTKQMGTMLPTGACEIHLVLSGCFHFVTAERLLSCKFGVLPCARELPYYLLEAFASLMLINVSSFLLFHHVNPKSQ